MTFREAATSGAPSALSAPLLLICFSTRLTPDWATSSVVQGSEWSWRMSVQMELHKIIISEMQDKQLIWLKEVDGERKFTIVIGSTEAIAIDRRLKGSPTPRPMTHDLLANVIEAMGGKLESIEINDLQVGTFYARLHIRVDGREVEVDSRPSDAIALGIATMVPIHVADHVLEEVSR